MNPYGPRPIIVYDMPLPEGGEIVRPETAILRFSHGDSIDVGALCYLYREASAANRKGRKTCEGRYVDPNSKDAERTERVRQLISLVSEHMTAGAWRSETAYSNLNSLVVLVTWTDANGYADVLGGEAQARAGVCAYLNHLRDAVNRNVLSVNTATNAQDRAFDLLRKLLSFDDLTVGLNLLRHSNKAKEPTVPPDEVVQAKALALCEALLSAFSELVLDNKSYPYWMAMPHYLGLPQNVLCVFPASYWCMPPHVIAIRHTLDQPCWAYQYSEGRLATLDELRAVRAYESNKCPEDQRRRAIQLGEEQLIKANSDIQHVRRREMALRALYAFLQVFLALTGMNGAQVVELPWDDDQYEEVPSRQQFRMIKYRAGGREVSFELPLRFINSFDRYLKVRRWLLNGQPCTLLFFQLGKHASGEPEQIRDISKYARNWYETLRGIDPSLPAITAREWRAAKSDWLIRFKDPATAALILQNSEGVVERSYAAGSQTTHFDEMSEFLDKVSARVAEMVLAKGEKIECSVSLAAGNCMAYGESAKIADATAIEPDCKRPEGCLFCDKFRVHADERNTRKLVSCRFCIQQVAPLAGSQERFEASLGPILKRIQEILEAIARREPDLVPRIIREVEQNGELDPYWESKLQMLMDLGLIT